MPSQQRSLRGPPKEKTRLLGDEFKEPASSTQVDQTTLFEVLAKDNFLQNMLAEAQALLERPEINTPGNEIINETLKPYKNKLKAYLQLTDLPSGNKLHNYYTEVEYLLPPDIYFLYNFQLNNQRMKDLDDNIEMFEILDYGIKEDTAIFVCRTTTKKILLIEPKTFFVVRVIKRLKENEYLECQKSVDLTPLGALGKYRAYQESLKNVGKIYINALKFFTKDGRYYSKALNKMDPLSAMGHTIVKSAVKPRLIRHQNSLLKKITQFALKADNANELIWFTSDAKEIGRIFDSSVAVIKGSGINAKELDEISQQSFHSKTSENADSVKSDDKSGDKSQLRLPGKTDQQLTAEGQSGPQNVTTPALSNDAKDALPLEEQMIVKETPQPTFIAQPPLQQVAQNQGDVLAAPENTPSDKPEVEGKKALEDSINLDEEQEGPIQDSNFTGPNKDSAQPDLFTAFIQGPTEDTNASGLRETRITESEVLSQDENAEPPRLPETALPQPKPSKADERPIFSTSTYEPLPVEEPPRLPDDEAPKFSQEPASNKKKRKKK